MSLWCLTIIIIILTILRFLLHNLLQLFVPVLQTALHSADGLTLGLWHDMQQETSIIYYRTHLLWAPLFNKCECARATTSTQYVHREHCAYTHTWVGVKRLRGGRLVSAGVSPQHSWPSLVVSLCCTLVYCGPWERLHGGKSVYYSVSPSIVQNHIIYCLYLPSMAHLVYTGL